MADNLDPDSLQRTQEELDKLRETISGLVPSFILMGAAMREQIAATKGLSGAEKDGKTIVDNWLKSQEAETAASKAATVATRQYDEAMANLNRALGNSVASITSFGKAMMTVGGGMGKYSDSVNHAGNALSDLSKAGGPIIQLFGGLAKVLSRIVGAVFEFNDNMLKGTDALGKMGIIGDITTDKFREMGAKAGYSAQRLEELAGVYKEVGSDIVGMGGSATEGAKAFNKLIEADEKVLQGYSRLGVTQTELNKNQANYIKLQIASGQQITERAKQDGSLRKASLEYTDNLMELSSLTGMEVDEIKKKQEAQRADLSYSVKQAQLQDKELALRAEFEKTGNVELQTRADALKRERENSDKLQDVAISMGLSGKQLSAFNSMVATGNFNELSAGFAAGTPGILEFIKAVKDGKKAPAEFVSFMSEANKTGRERYGDAIIQSKEVGDALNISAETMRNEAKFRGKTNAEIMAMAAEEKAARDRQKAGGVDPAKDARAAQQTTERKMQLAADSLVSVVQGPITKAFEYFQKAMTTVAKYLAKFAVWLGAPDFTDMFKTPEEIKQDQEANAADLKKITQNIKETEKQLADPAAFKEELMKRKEVAEKAYMEQAQHTENLKKLYKEASTAEQKAQLDKQIIESRKQEMAKKAEADEASIRARNAKTKLTDTEKANIENKLLELEKKKLEVAEKQKTLAERAKTLESAPPTPQTAAKAPVSKEPGGMNSYLQKVAQVESGGKADAKAKTSSASGLFQFTEGSWKDTTKAMGKNYSLEDRFDPKKSAEVAQFYTERQKAQVEKGTGREASEADLYMAHFLGAGGATKFLNAMAKNPNALATEGADPKQIEANKPIFYEDGGKGKMRTLQEVYDMMARKLDKAGEALAAGKGGADIAKMELPGANAPQMAQAETKKTDDSGRATAATDSRLASNKPAEIPTADTGGVFDGPPQGYPVMLHGNEMVIPMPDTRSLEVQKTELSEVTNNNTTTNNVQTVTESSLDMAPFMEFFELLSEKLDTLIEAIEDGNDHTEKLVKFSAV